jgi:ribonuclease-3
MSASGHSVNSNEKKSFEISLEQKGSLAIFQKVLNYKFSDNNLLLTALTHKSYALERVNTDFNERMEFLGDSILSACCAMYLYNKHPEMQEGGLSKLKARAVSAKNLLLWAGRIKLESVLRLGKVENASGARQKEAIICDAFEAVIGAIFLDGGFEKAKNFVFGFLESQGDIEVSDYKSELQEILQKQYKVLPEYKLIREYGPGHERKFEAGVYLKGKLLGSGTAFSKKAAQMEAAKVALSNIKKQNS